jgi:hypothetical protein
MVRHYYGAPLPDYLYEKYGHLNPPQGGLKSKNEDYVRFENFLAGTGNTFIGRGAPTSGTATHLLHLKALKNPIDFMRYMKGVVFPGKEFMVEKYSPLNPPQGGLEKKRGSSFPLEFVRPLTEVRGKYWWLWYGYRWAMGLKGLWLVITGTSTSSVTKK